MRPAFPVAGSPQPLARRKNMFGHAIKKILSPIAKPILRHATRDLTDGDVWSKTKERLPKEMFCLGTRK